MTLRSRSWVTQLGMLTLAAGLAASSAAVAQDNPNEKGEGRGASSAAQTIAPPDSTTEGSVTVGGQPIAYKAVAGTITVGATDEQDATLAPDGSLLPGSGVKPATDPAQAPPTARMFYVAYFRKDTTDETHRPVMFIYNGGPGSATMWLHMGTFGPKRIVLPDTEHQEAAPYTIVNNQYSLLDTSDLVFIDAPGTGFSRTFGKDRAKAFYGIDGDGQAFNHFIRKFLTKYERWNSPKYIFGESYGTPRSAVLSADLNGVDLNGVILLSQILSFDNSIDAPDVNPGVDQAYALALPTMAATAWYYHKLANPPASLHPFLEEVEKYALTDYMEALLQGSELPDAQKQAVAEKLHDYTGLPTDYWIRANLRVKGGEFSKELKLDSDTTIGRLDTRYQGPNVDPLSESTEYDPQSDAITSGWLAAINDYLRKDLKYGMDATYFPNGRMGGDFNWSMEHRAPGFGRFGGGDWGGPNVMPDLAYRMKMNPKMKVLLAGGYFDLATPFFEGMYEMHHLPMPNSLQSNISYHYYEAGHMIYANEDALRQFRGDVENFIKSTESGK